VRKYSKGVTLLIVLLMFVLYLSPSVEANSNSVQFYTTDVFYDSSDRLVVRGYFVNNEDRAITRVTKMRLIVKVTTGYEDLWTLADFTVYDAVLNLGPGERSGLWNCSTPKADRVNIKRWNVSKYLSWSHE